MMNPSDEPEELRAARFRFQEEQERFLSRVETLITGGLLREALALARERLDLIPGDVDARIVCGRVLAAMGRAGTAREIFEEIEKDILSWVGVFEDLGDILAGKGEIERAGTCYQNMVQLGLDAEAVERIRKKMEALKGAEREQDDRLIDGVSRDFKTMTMADLYVRQGHLDTARNVLKEMMQSDPGNIRVREKLREVEVLLAGNVPLSGKSHPEKILHELEKWLGNVKRLGNHG